MATVAIATLGCKVNQFESEAMIESLEREGYRLVPFGEQADVTIINTCTVTHRADFQSRQMVRRAHRSNPGTLVVVTGCYAQIDAEKLSKIEGVNYVLGNREKNSIAEFLPRMERGDLPKILVEDIGQTTLFGDTPTLSFRHHTRAFLKIQDGCNASCSYCIVPQARGKSRSLAPEGVLGRLKDLKDKGYKEVVLTGIHLGAYGLDLSPRVPLERLLEQVESAESPLRVRLSSMEPGDFSPDLVTLLSRSSKICPHLHIPIQSGDDEILKGMNRNYVRSFVSGLIRELHERIPMVSIGADIIVGFPGETEERFQNTVALISSLPLTYLHVFPFSKRKGTPAAQLPQEVDEEKIKIRAERLRALGKEKRMAFYQRFLGKEMAVLVEDREKKETGWRGLSRNYIPVFLAEERMLQGRDWANEEILVSVTGMTEKGLIGRVGNAEGADTESERFGSLRELEERVGYRFKEIEWLDRALTHKSFMHESPTIQPDPARENGNEVLEFLGDAVLSLAISHLLLKAYPEAQEGTLSKKRSHLVKRSFLAHLSRELQLEDHLLLGKGELLDGGRKKASILANVYEALIGAIYLDSGFDRSLEIVRYHFESYLDSETASSLFSDYKSLLQERVQQSYRLSPKYRVAEESGPDHDKRFQATVLIDQEVMGSGWGKNKKEAEQEAAKKALEELQSAESRLQIEGPETRKAVEEIDSHSSSGTSAQTLNENSDPRDNNPTLTLSRQERKVRPISHFPSPPAGEGWGEGEDNDNE
jgi:threonylcarbamoyladenosine tRNA methylthiotransferase MtaB